VSLLVDRWSEEWSKLSWLRLEGVASLIAPDAPGGEHAAALSALRKRYPQYLEQDLETRPVMRITLRRVTGWSATQHRD
jgi:hypothetical protein